MHGGPGDLHIIIHGQSQKLSILRHTPYKQFSLRWVRRSGSRETNIISRNAAKTTLWILLVQSEQGSVVISLIPAVTFQPNEWISHNLFYTLRIYVISSMSR